MNLHKLLFPEKEKEMERLSDKYLQALSDKAELKAMKERLEKNTPEEMENLMRHSLGLPYLRFDNIEQDTKGADNPPHYLKGLDKQARLAFVGEMSQIFRNDKFKIVWSWYINVLGNHSIQKAPDKDMANGRIGMVALRGFRKEFEDADAEYQDSTKDTDEDFDRHAPLPD